MSGALATAMAGAALVGGVAMLAPATAQTSAAARDWTRVVAMTAEGGFRIGNPDAPVKLVEYGSLTCGHCADFHREAMDELKRDHIASGRVSYEFRNFVLNGPDLAASLLARCEGAPAFFERTDYFLDQQRQWLEPFSTIAPAERERLSRLPQDQMLLGFVSAAGLEGRMAARGMPSAKVRQCLLDKNAVDQLVRMRKTAEATHSINSTPSFLINGKALESVHDWAALEPLLSAGG